MSTPQGPLQDQLKATAAADGAKAGAWLKRFWYQFGIGVVVGALLAHWFWK